MNDIETPTLKGIGIHERVDGKWYVALGKALRVERENGIAEEVGEDGYVRSTLTGERWATLHMEEESFVVVDTFEEALELVKEHAEA